MVPPVKLAACGVLAIHAIACGGATTSGVPADAKSIQQSAPKTAASTAIPDCDEYVRVVSRCIETKVPEENRAEERQKLDAARRAIQTSSYGAAIVGASCKENLIATVRYDDFGCYAEDAARHGIQTACTVMTRAELEAALGAKLADGVQRSNNCTYDFPGQPFRHPFSMKVEWKGGSDEVAAARGAQAMVSGRLQKEAGKGDLVEGGAVEGVGDEAFFTLAGIRPMLSARRGDVSVSLGGADRDQMIAIARTALARIKEDAQ